MNHLSILSEAAAATSFVANADLLCAEKAVHGLLDQYPALDGIEMSDALSGESRLSLGQLEILRDCLESNGKYLTKFGALAVLSAMAWNYAPDSTGANEGFLDRNSAAAMSVLMEFLYSSSDRVADTALAVAAAIGNAGRDRSIDDVQTTLITHTPNVVPDDEPVSEEMGATDEIVAIDDAAMRRRVASFPWIDSDLDDIELNARLERGLNGQDALIVDLSPYSSQMQPILADARAHFSERTLRSMELQQVSRLLTGDQSGRIKPPQFRDPSLPDSYCAKPPSSNVTFRRLYVARIGAYRGLPVFARLGYSRTKQNQSRLSQILGYLRVSE